ncbi:MAG: hypothetical protein JWR74_3024 [Polaromonas sp.]|nr:hypothetical protein [Polaromonas sp.]
MGQLAFQNRSVPLTQRQRSAFIQFDGKRALDQIMSTMSGLGVTPGDIDHLVALGFLAPGFVPPIAAVLPDASVAQKGQGAPEGKSAPIEGFSMAPPSVAADGLPTANAQAHYSKAYPIATRLTARLGLRGFRLNLAVEAAGDLDKLRELAPKIKSAIGPEKFQELEAALYD